MTQTENFVSVPQALPVNSNQIDALFDKVAAQLVANRHVPGSTYRVQMNKYFTFNDTINQLDYLHSLGITDLYASPYLRARKDSLHGYDICNHNELNPGIGTEAEYNQMIERLQANRMSQILDFVPNHMGIGETCNYWWMDVLENGPSSIYANYFDINWHSVTPELQDKVLIPKLGDQYGVILEKGELQVKFEPEEGAFYLDYYDNRFPINPRTYPDILSLTVEPLREKLGEDNENFLELQSIITNFSHLPPRTETNKALVLERNREKEILKRRLASLCQNAPQVQTAIEVALKQVNGNPEDPTSFNALDNLIEEQAYRLSYWKTASEEINYRRFFDVNDLAAIKMELPEVYEDSHRLIRKLLENGDLQGLRIDHADGLWDPAGYFWNLQCSYFLDTARKELDKERNQKIEDGEWETLSQTLLQRLERERTENPRSPLLTALYVVPEKILGYGEQLPDNWTADGTSGYDFLNQVNQIFVDSSSEKAITDIYNRFIGIVWRFNDLVYSRKQIITRISLASEINMLAQLLRRVSQQDRHYRDFTLNDLRLAIREVIACFPVYRTYTVALTGVVERRDQAYIERAVANAKKRNPARDPSVFNFLRDILLLKLIEGQDDEAQAMQREFVMKFQQMTGPIMAKGLEDTTFYIFNRLISLNEVGGDPDHFGQSVDNFHRQNLERQKRWPHTMLTTSTHDTKRSEDVRARINVISELPAQWETVLNRWAELNARSRTELEDKFAPDGNDEYLLYQTLVGIWPFGEVGDEEYQELIKRVQEYMIKALREAKINTSWINPNQEYEDGVTHFIENILDRSRNNPFLNNFKEFQVKACHFGLFNSLSQLLIKLTCPGVPDFYQGNEIWDLSLVDPDNRRPIDYDLRKKLLAGLPTSSDVNAVRQLLDNKTDGKLKLYLTNCGLQYRNQHRELFDTGDYVPLTAKGHAAEHLCSYARVATGKEIIVVAPRLLAKLTNGEIVDPLGANWWQDTNLVLAESLTGTKYRNVLTGEVIEKQEKGGLPLAQVLANFPVALLEKID